MPWNEPGNKNKDPWGGSNNSGSPDLDEAFKKFQRTLSSIFGGTGSGSGGSESATIGTLLSFLIVAAWVVWCSYLIDEQELGVVLQFGQYKETRQPGFNFVFQPVQTLEKVTVSQFQTVKNKAIMLTQDEVMVSIEYEVQYNISDPVDYLYRVKQPVDTLSEASESAIREIIGKNTLDHIIGEGREVIGPKTKSLLQEILNRYESGLNVIKVNLKDATQPKEVLFAFEDVNKAREDKERYVHEAEAYRNEIVPVARGDAQRLIEDANAYKARVINSAQGEADRFVKLLKEYEKAPKVTRERLYIDAIESVLSKSNKVMVDIKQGNNMLYLPLDQILRNKDQSGNTSQSGSGNVPTQRTTTSPPGTLDDARTRGRQ